MTAHPWSCQNPGSDNTHPAHHAPDPSPFAAGIGGVTGGSCGALAVVGATAPFARGAGGVPDASGAAAPTRAGGNAAQAAPQPDRA